MSDYDERVESLRQRSEENRRKAWDLRRALGLGHCVWDIDAKDHGEHSFEGSGACVCCPVWRCLRCKALTDDIEGHCIIEGHANAEPVVGRQYDDPNLARFSQLIRDALVGKGLLKAELRGVNEMLRLYADYRKANGYERDPIGEERG